MNTKQSGRMRVHLGTKRKDVQVTYKELPKVNEAAKLYDIKEFCRTVKCSLPYAPWD